MSDGVIKATSIKMGQSVQGSGRAVVIAKERSGSVTQAWSTDVLDLSVMQVDDGFSDSARS